MSEVIFPDKNITVVLVVKNDEGQPLRKELHQVDLRFEMEVTESELGELSTSEYIEQNGLPDLVSALTGETLGAPTVSTESVRTAPGEVPEESPPMSEPDDEPTGTTDVDAPEERISSSFCRMPRPEAPE